MCSSLLYRSDGWHTIVTTTDLKLDAEQSSVNMMVDMYVSPDIHIPTTLLNNRFFFFLQGDSKKSSRIYRKRGT